MRQLCHPTQSELCGCSHTANAATHADDRQDHACTLQNYLCGSEESKGVGGSEECVRASDASHAQVLCGSLEAVNKPTTNHDCRSIPGAWRVELPALSTSIFMYLVPPTASGAAACSLCLWFDLSVLGGCAFAFARRQGSVSSPLPPPGPLWHLNRRYTLYSENSSC